ncbi:MAG: DUF5011 domain-containing protein [Gemmatimonadetes bacterium]|nr:DUF5011 domain-containing protein [Gemmatimonadota bacterium]
MKSRLSSFVRRCAVLALVALAASSAFAQSTPGQIGGALSFDGVDDWVHIPTTHPSVYTLYKDVALQENEDALTIEAWFRVDDMAPGRVHSIFSNGTNVPNMSLRILVFDGILEAGIRNGETEGGAPYPYKHWRTPAGSVVEGQWHHVAFVVRTYKYGGQKVRSEFTLYLDGVQVAYHNGGFYGLYISDMYGKIYYVEQLAIGMDLEYASSRYFGGAMDEVRFWGIARSASEIADNMHSPLTGSEAGLIGYWSLDEGDTQPPTITFPDGSEVTVGESTTYVDPVTATDVTSITQVIDESDTGHHGVFESGGTPTPVDLSVSGTVGTALGDYTLTYTATDAAGNTATATRLVHVVDMTPPVITLNGSAEAYVVEGTDYNDPLASALDNHDGTLPVTVDETLGANSAIGDYTLTYTATDAAGNTGTAERLVHVVSFGDAYDWEQVPGSAVDIAFGGNGVLYMTGSDSGIYKWEEDDWVEIEGYGQRIGVAPDGTPWIVNDLGWVLRWDPESAAFVRVPDAGEGGAIDIGMGGEVWVLAEFGTPGIHQAYRWDAATYSWRETGGYRGTAIDVGPDGSAWMRINDGDVYQFYMSMEEPFWGSNSAIGGGVGDVALGYDGSTWCVAEGTGDGEVRRWNVSSNSWEKINGVGKAISVSPDGIAWVVRADGTIWKGVPGGRYQ